jgi:hypothetical protein
MIKQLRYDALENSIPGLESLDSGTGAVQSTALDASVDEAVIGDFSALVRSDNFCRVSGRAQELIRDVGLNAPVIHARENKRRQAIVEGIHSFCRSSIMTRSLALRTLMFEDGSPLQPIVRQLRDPPMVKTACSAHAQ